LAVRRRYLASHWPAVALLVASSYVATALPALLPLLMAPILDLALGRPIGPRDGAIGLDGVTLENLGAAMLQWLGVHAVDDRLRAIAFLCLAYVPGTALPFAERLAAVVADADLRGLMAVENRARVRSEFDAQGMLTAPEGVYRQVLAL
jgi:hypothetical protein